MDWLKSKRTAVIGVCVALIAFQGYGFVSMRSALENRMSWLERDMQEVRGLNSSKVSQLASDLNVVTNRMGVTMQELQQARSMTEALKQEHARTAQRLRSQLAAKADSRLVSQVQQEASTKLAEVQQDATTKFTAVSGEVQVVRTDLDTTREELASNRKDITDVKTEIARNAGELAELRRKGERDYFEFDIPKTKKFERIADVQVQLKKTDVKRQKYDIVLQADVTASKRRTVRPMSPFSSWLDAIGSVMNSSSTTSTKIGSGVTSARRKTRFSQQRVPRSGGRPSSGGGDEASDPSGYGGDRQFAASAVQPPDAVL